uniref:Protein CASC3 n=1 Tax=Parastrongyloides trichosuri TaxID=131310 RepID=A0A0N5A1M4_PARTI
MATKTDNLNGNGQETRESEEVKDIENNLIKMNIEDKEEVPTDPINSNKDGHQQSPCSTDSTNVRRGRKNQKDDLKDPTDIPKSGKYYMHDDRGESAKEIIKKNVNKDTKEWKHDKYDEEKQTPKSKSELIKTYENDVREKKEMVEKAVKGRGRTRYGKKESLEMDEITIVKKEKEGEKKKVNSQEKDNYKNKKNLVNNNEKDKQNDKPKLKVLKGPKQTRIRNRTRKFRTSSNVKEKEERIGEYKEYHPPRKETNDIKKKTKDDISYVKKYEVAGHVITQPIRKEKLINDQQPSRKINHRNTNTSKSVRGSSSYRYNRRGGSFHAPIVNYHFPLEDCNVKSPPIAVYVKQDPLPYQQVIQYANVIPTQPMLPPTGAVYFNMPTVPPPHPRPEKRERKILPIADPSKQDNEGQKN